MERRLAAILSADMVGYSRLMEADERGTIARQKAHRAELIDPKIAEHHGRIVKTTGDGLLAEFGSVVDAVECALAIQQDLAKREADIPEDRRIQYRAGINLGDIVIDNDDILGDGVNVAARLQEASTAGGLALSSVAYESLGNLVAAVFEDGGQRQFKNIARPIQMWRWVPDKPLTTGETLHLPDKPSIAVLPFDNMSGDPEQEYFADGIAEDVLTTLSKIQELVVIARNSSFAFKGQAKDVREIGQTLGARYVLEGSVRKAGNRIRLTAQLIDSSDHRHVWADRFDGELDDVFDLQDRITQEIATALEVQLTSGEQARVWRKRSGSPLVYEHFLNGRSLYLNFSRHSHAQARHALEKALEINPTFTPALVMLGYTLADQARFGWEEDRAATFEAALGCAARALDTDAGCGEAYTVIGYVRNWQHRHEEAIEAGEKAIALCPNGSDAYHMAGMIHGYAGHFRKAAEYEARAQRLMPISRNELMVDEARAKLHLRNFVAARDIAARVLHAKPTWLTAQTVLLAALWHLGREDEARHIAQDMLSHHPDFSVNRWARMFPYRHQADLEILMAPLRNAGMPE